VCPEKVERAMIEKLGKYQVAEQIGRGGMGAVYKAHDPLLKRVVALKVISENVDVADELRARFFREAQACAQLSHPNIITIYDLGEDAGRLFIVMEYLEGEELKQVIAQHRDLSIESKLALMAQICEGLAYAHQKGIVHRDVKPSNVFVLRSGTAKVLDFGVARIASANEDLTHTGLLMGTLRYMSPEQARGRVDQRSDMFSAAAVFYELLAYHPPLSFDDPMAILEELRSTESPSRFRPDPAIPEDLAAVIERALRKNPDERFRDMTEMREALDAVRARLAAEAAELRRRLEGQTSEAGELHARLEVHVGGGVGQDALPAPVERAPVAGLEALWREREDKLARLRERVERARALRPDYEHAMDQMGLGQWEAAAETFERIAEAMPEHAGAQEGSTRARAEIARAAEVERERQAAEHSQQLMEELRHRAAPAAALADGQALWESAEANRVAGLSAVAEESYAAAAGRFDAAAGQYRAVAEVLDRRVEQLLQDARGRLEERQFEECLRLLSEVVALVPSQPEAVALNLEAQRGAREEAERQAALEERYDAAREKLAAGDLDGAVDALSDLVEQDPHHSRARQLLDDAREQLADEVARASQALEAVHEPSIAASLPQTALEAPDDATVFQRIPPAEPSSPPATSGAAEAPVAAAAMEVQPAELGPPPAESGEAVQDAGRVEPAWLRRIRSRPLVVAVGGSLVVACAIVWIVASLLTNTASRRVQGEVEQAQKHLETTREEALKVEANRLATDLFDRAAAKERDGEQLRMGGSVGPAITALREAAALYEEAGRAARVAGEERTRADQARALMLAEKKRATPETTEFKEALARESEGESRYGKLAFQDAAESFRAAARLFAMVPPPAPAPPAPTPAPPAPAAPDSAAEIRETLRLYTRVFEAKDLTLLQRIRPGISADELSRYRGVFETTRSFRVNLKVDAIKVTGDEADATGRREDIKVTSDGETIRDSRQFHFRLKRSNNRWTIVAVK